jgi:hypothetical protein
MTEMRNTWKILVQKLEAVSLLGKSECGWVENIRKGP